MDVDGVVVAFEDASFEHARYLDLETGEVVLVTEEIRSELERLSEEADNDAGITQAAAKSDLPDWEKDWILEAARVEAGLGTRYLEIPKADPSKAYADMEDFAATVAGERLAERLRQAIGSSRPFRRFKDVLAGDPAERQRWYRFREDAARRRALAWLTEQGVEPVADAQAERHEPPPPRLRLIAEALAFVRAASRLAGVARIGLLGSLATSKDHPKDVDMLVTVTDDADLAPLAALARKMAGRAQSLGLGADVFLADPAGWYLGRTCPWRRCGPGIRAGCDALSCGRRPYLHDDLRTVQLPPSLVAGPPLDLWPEVRLRTSVPEDLRDGLVTPLAAGDPIGEEPPF